MMISKELVAASATPIILAILQTKDSYGYAIIRKVQEISDNQIAWTDGMLYPVLHRLETAGLIESYWLDADSGRRRKYYHITNAGNEECALLKQQWAVVQRALQVLAEDTQD
ncbi:MAG: PadR family transcriptional regulator [Spirochaetae bacterium HGW-Spirochaetae-8]|jgi:DNA-binding PadR family transcriptional regulator|nr:MAG: PadR family transcriptional regulator [Spirochaetae bacterium HGW-Spirochaetae-8]